MRQPIFPHMRAHFQNFYIMNLRSLRERIHVLRRCSFDPTDDERAVKDARHAIRFLEKKRYVPVAIDLTENERNAVLASDSYNSRTFRRTCPRPRAHPDFMREFRKKISVAKNRRLMAKV